MDWSTAESQVAKIAGSAGTKSTVISVKSSGQNLGKRKASGEAGDGGAGGAKKPTRRGKKVKR